jgi:hypothetical protein
MAFAAYATIPELKAWVELGDTVDDVVMQGVLDSVSRWVDQYCDRHFWRDGGTGTEVARTFAACRSWRVNIDDLVPGTITTLKTDASGDGTFETTWSASDYQLLPANRPNGEPFNAVEAVAGRLFPGRSTSGSRGNRIEITGIWGWTAVPAPVKQACLEMAARELKRRFSPEGVSGFGDLGLARVSSQLDPDVARNLNDYRLYGEGVMVG